MLLNRNPRVLNVLFAYLSLFFLGLADNLRGPLYPEMVRELGLSHSQGGWFFSISSIMCLAGGAVVALILKRFRYLKSYQISVGVMMFSQVLFVLADRFWVYLLASLCLGFSIGLISVIQNVLVLTAATAHNSGRLQSGLHANYAGASLLAPLVVAVLASYGLPIKVSFGLAALIGCLLLLGTLAVPHFLESAPRTKTEKARDPLPIFQVGVFVWILASYVLAEIVISTRLPQFLREQMGQSLLDSSLGASLFFVGLFVGRLLFAFVQLPFSFRTQMLASLMSFSGFVLLGVYFHPLFFVLTGFAMGPFYPLSMALLNESFPRHLEAVSTACAVGSGLFAAGMHLLAGVVSDHFGIVGTMLLVPLFGFMSFVPLFFYFRLVPRMNAKNQVAR